MPWVNTTMFRHGAVWRYVSPFLHGGLFYYFIFFLIRPSMLSLFRFKPLLKHGQRVSTTKKTGRSIVVKTLVQCTSKNTIKVNKNIEFLWILYVVWMSHNGQPNMTSTTVFSQLKPSDHVICTATNDNSFPTPRATILRPIFYCCNTFDYCV